MTKYIVCLGDGMADEPLEELGNKTPLQVANIPNMDYFAKTGKCGLVATVPEGCHPGSDVANMGILGYDPREYYSGRGAIEAAAMNIQAAEDEIYFRCNLVCIKENNMISFTSDHITTEEADQLLNALNEHFDDNGINFFTGVSYRHILTLKDSFAGLKTVAPHDILDKNIIEYLPQGNNQDQIHNIIEQAHNVLINHPINLKRLEQNKLPATHIWPWSPGKRPKLSPFFEKYGMRGGIVTAVDLLKGLANLTGLDYPSVKGATGFLDTNYKAKFDAGLKILENDQFVYLHIEAPDEAGHMGDPNLKIKAIEDFDKEIVGRVRKYCEKNPDTRVLIMPDHPTPCKYKTHTSNPVPYVVSGKNAPANTVSEYHESPDGLSDNDFFQYPWELMDYFVEK